MVILQMMSGICSIICFLWIPYGREPAPLLSPFYQNPSPHFSVIWNYWALFQLSNWRDLQASLWRLPSFFKCCQLRNYSFSNLPHSPWWNVPTEISRSFSDRSLRSRIESLILKAFKLLNIKTENIFPISQYALYNFWIQCTTHFQASVYYLSIHWFIIHAHVYFI